MENQPRKHHFVQARHIRQFTDEAGAVNVFGKDGNVFRASPEAIFKKKDLNSYDSPDGLNTDFETFVSEIESSSWPSLQRTIDNERIDSEDIEYILLYLSLSRLRNPTIQEGILEFNRQAVETTAKLMDMHGQFDDIGSPPVAPKKSITELLESGMIEIAVDNSRYLKALVDMLEPFQSLLFKGYGWSLVKSLRARVIISDHPLTFVHPAQNPGAYGIPLGGKTCEVAFPLSKELYLIGLWENTAADIESEDVVDELNKRQAMFASRHIATCHDSKHFRSLARRYQGFGYQTVSSRAGPLDGGFQILRSSVFPLPGPRLFKGKHPLEKTKPLKSMLLKSPAEP